MEGVLSSVQKNVLEVIIVLRIANNRLVPKISAQKINVRVLFGQSGPHVRLPVELRLRNHELGHVLMNPNVKPNV